MNDKTLNEVIDIILLLGGSAIGCWVLLYIAFWLSSLTEPRYTGGQRMTARRDQSFIFTLTRNYDEWVCEATYQGHTVRVRRATMAGALRAARRTMQKHIALCVPTCIVTAGRMEH